MNVRVAAGRALTYLTITAGTLLAVSRLPLSALIAMAVLVGLVAVGAATLGRVRTVTATLGAASLPGGTALVGAVLLSLIGFAAFLGLSGAAVVAAAVAAGVYLCRPQAALTSDDRQPNMAGPGGDLAAADGRTLLDDRSRPRLREPCELSDTELCEAWRISYLFITRVCDPASVDRIATVRQAYLDEMQRRDPPGFARWMASGARAASNPAPFLGHHEN